MYNHFDYEGKNDQRSGDIARYLPNIQEIWVQSPAAHKTWCYMSVISTWEVVTGESEVQGHFDYTV